MTKQGTRFPASSWFHSFSWGRGMFADSGALGLSHDAELSSRYGRDLQWNRILRGRQAGR